MKKMLKSHIAGAATAASLLILSSCDDRPPAGSVRAEKAWVRLPAAKGQPGSAYFRLEAGSEGTRLTSVSSPLVRRIELHETKTEGSVSKMRRKKEIEFPYDGELTFEPAGRHAMLFEIHSSVQPGGKLPLTFSFDTAPPVTVEAEVRSVADSHEDH